MQEIDEDGDANEESVPAMQGDVCTYTCTCARTRVRLVSLKTLMVYAYARLALVYGPQSGCQSHSVSVSFALPNVVSFVVSSVVSSGSS